VAALAVGFAAGNQTGTVIFRAALVMVASWWIGQAVGAVAQRTIDVEAEDYVKANPLPELSSFDVAGEGEPASELADAESEVAQPSPEA